MRSNRKTSRSRTQTLRRAVIDALEPRRMLAAFGGTNGPDTIIVYNVGDDLHVTINGVDNVTADPQVSVFGAGGNDTVRLLSCAAVHKVIFHLGTGDDLFTTYDPASNTATVGDIDGEVFVGGEDGFDTIVIDDSDGLGFETCTLDFEIFQGSADHTFDFGTTHFRLRDIEVFELNQNSRSTNTHLVAKDPTTDLTVLAGSGDDRLFVGGGNFETNGWTVGTTTLFGGGGNDSIEFSDSLGTVAQPLTVAGFTISRGSWGCTYSAFESQEVRGGNGSLNDRVVTINGPSNFVTETTVNTENGVVNLLSVSPTTFVEGAPHAVNIASGDLAALGGNVSLDLTRRGLETVTINDQNSSVFPSSYEVASTAFVKSSTGQTIPYVGVNALVLNTTPLADSITVSSVAQFMSVTVNSNAGNDTLRIGNGNMGLTLLGPVTMNGGLGTDTGFFVNTFDNTFSTQVLNGLSLTDSGITHGFTGLEALRVNLGPGGSNLTVNSTSVQTNVSGNSGNDTFTVGGGNIAANFPAPVPSAPFFDGGGGTDAIILDDFNGAGTGGSYTFERPNGIDRLARGFGSIWFINWANMESATLEASDATTTGTTTVDIFAFESLTPLRINGNGGSDRVFVMDPAHPVIVNTGTGTHDQLEVNFAGGAPCTVIVDQDDEVNGLRVNPGGTLQVPAGATLAKSQVSDVSNYFEITGTLDLVGGALLSRAGGPALATFQTWLTRGFNGGAWNGTHASGSINSSLAATSPFSDGVGYGLGSQIAPTTTGPFSIAAGDTLLRYALDGDADLSGNVNLNDFNRLAADFGQSNRNWVDGDSTFDGLVNLSDFNAMAGNFGSSAAPGGLPMRSIRGARDGEELRKLLEELT